MKISPKAFFTYEQIKHKSTSQKLGVKEEIGGVSSPYNALSTYLPNISISHVYVRISKYIYNIELLFCGVFSQEVISLVDKWLIFFEKHRHNFCTRIMRSVEIIDFWVVRKLRHRFRVGRLTDSFWSKDAV